MILYILAFLILSLPPLLNPKSRVSAYTLTFLILFVGLRDRIGADWYSYYLYSLSFKGTTFLNSLQVVEPGYAFFNYISSPLDNPLFLVNILCSLFFLIPLYLFCRDQPRPALALCLAFPYLIVVVAMGYSRQSVSIGFELLALLALQRKQLFRFSAYILLAFLFHRTALILLILPITTIKASFRFHSILKFTAILFVTYYAIQSSVVPQLDYYVTGYLEQSYQSQGAYLRLLLCLLPSLVFIINTRKFNLSQTSTRLWLTISYLTVLAFASLFLVSSSTAIDRLSLYLIPIQIFVGARLPNTGFLGLSSTSLSQLLVLYSFSLMMFWLLFAGHSFAWLPYRNILLPF